jgi:hypothetical protein
VLSATPPRDIPETAVFPDTERERALDHPVLRKRLQASKPAELIEVKTPRASGNDPLVAEAVKRAQGYVQAGKRRVGVIVNPVRTAQEIARRLREQPGDGRRHRAAHGPHAPVRARPARRGLEALPPGHDAG